MKLRNDDGETFGQEWTSKNELAAFVAWHDEGEQRSLFETFEDGDLENQITWWRNGGHLIDPENPEEEEDGQGNT